MKINILNLSIKELETETLALGQQKFRAKQVFNWIYKKNVFNFEDMSNLPKNFLIKLNEKFSIHLPQIQDIKYSNSDNSYKFLLKTYDDNLIESIAIQKDKRMTLCVSCMIGCPLGCKFCATGTQIKFKRNLDTAEILGQYIIVLNYLLDKKITKSITNIVYMGMGEPFLNIKDVGKSINIFTDKQAFEVSKNKITISTAGITKGLSEFINEYNINLAVSIHFPTNDQRSEFMPINKKIPLENLITELKKINLEKRKFITIEYLMIDKINDTLFHAQELNKLLKNLKVKVNLIPYNPTTIFKANNSTEDQINKFAKYLNSKSIFVSVRRSKGKDVLGGCGQFALK
jgi:23S rRNA (adenine2503-C2)-methyltransferase